MATLIHFPMEGAAARPPAPLVCDCGGVLGWSKDGGCWLCPDCGAEYDEEPDRERVLSPSQVRTFMDCAARWRFKYVERLPEPKTSSLALGIAVHDALGRNWARKIETGADLPAGAVVDEFRAAWAVAQETTAFRDEEDPAALGSAGAGLVEAFMAEAAASIQPAAVEIAVEGRIGGAPVQGRVDVLDAAGTIVDVKTAQKKPGELEPSQVFQLATYDMLTPGASGQARIVTLVRTKVPQVVQHTRTLTAQDYRAVEVQYPLILDAMRQGLYVPNRCSMMCSRRNCAFWRRCEAEYGGEVPLS